MKNLTMLLCPCALLAFSSTPMFADTIVPFSFSGSAATSDTGDPGTPFSGSGSFDITPTATAGKFTIVSVTGTTDGQSILKIIKKNGFDENDNFLFYNGSSYSLDNSGVSYQLANGLDVGVFLGLPDQYQQTIFGVAGTLVSEDQTAPVTIGVAATPEPSSLVLLGTGALGLLGLGRRKFNV